MAADSPASPAGHATTHRAIDAVWRIEQARIVAGVARLVRDIGLAEELAQDAWWRRSSTGHARACPPTRGPGS